jgi:hypothetical protein
MVTVKKKPSSKTLNELRPIMLLEVLRKEFLSIIYSRIDTILRTNFIFNPSQRGGLARAGTEDAILTIKNAIEAAWQDGSPLFILAFDKSKAFDSPPRTYISLAWERMGLPPDVAHYLAAIDELNEVLPKTIYSALFPSLAQVFRAISGIPQGDSLSCRSYIVIEDILLDFLYSQRKNMDLFMYRAPSMMKN